METLQQINIAIEYTKQRKFRSAEKIYKKLLKDKKTANVILSFLGLLYMNWGKYKKSEKVLEQAYSLTKGQTTAEGLALVNYYLGKPEDALKYFEKIIDTTKNIEVYKKYIDLLLDKRKHSKAMEYAQKCAELFPLNKDVQSNLVKTYVYNGELKEAYNLSLKMIKNYPKYSGGWLWHGLMLEMLFNDDIEAEKSFRNVLKYGDKYQGYYNLAVNASRRWELDKSLYYSKKSKKYGNSTISYLFSEACFYMRKRKFKKGLKSYNKYIHLNRFEDKKGQMSKLKNIWDGKNYKNETLFVYGDQGIGDLIMFSRFLPFVSEKFKTVKVLIRDNIYSLFKRSFKEYKNIKFYNPSNVKRLPHYDKSGIMACLPGYLNADYENIPFSGGYMIADPQKNEKYKKIINSEKLKVGICWEAGAAGWREQLSRTLHISLYEPLFRIKNAQFYSFQVNPSLNDHKKYSEIIDLGSDFNDFDDTAAALLNIDVLVSVDTSLAHLAGALGVKTFMLLPVNTDWRWFNDDKKTNWYDSITIFKQQPQSNWDSVIDNIKTELEKLI